jgi:hypothetical protein
VHSLWRSSRRDAAAIYLFSVTLKLWEEKMGRGLKTALFGALCGAFFFAATTSVSAGPMRSSLPPEDFGSTSFVEKALVLGNVFRLWRSS